MPSLSDSMTSSDTAVTQFRIKLGCTIANLSTVSTLSCNFVYFEGCLWDTFKTESLGCCLIKILVVFK